MRAVIAETETMRKVIIGLVDGLQMGDRPEFAVEMVVALAQDGMVSNSSPPLLYF
jgi:hypothetical protein